MSGVPLDGGLAWLLNACHICVFARARVCVCVCVCVCEREREREREREKEKEKERERERGGGVNTPFAILESKCRGGRIQ